MTIDTQKLRRIGTLLDEGYQIEDRSGVVTQAADEIDRLQRIIDTRPALNAGLTEAYIEWTQYIYAMEAAHAQGVPQ